MTEILQILAIFLSSSGSYTPPQTPICQRNIDHLPLERKIEFSIGCSTINGRQVYFSHNLKEILGDEQV